MRSHRQRANRTFILERLEDRSLLSGGPHVPFPPGSLIPGFGTGGIATAQILGPTGDTAGGVAIQQQANGQIVVAGTATPAEAESDFALALQYRWQPRHQLRQRRHGPHALHIRGCGVRGHGLGHGDPAQRPDRGGGNGISGIG